MQTRRVSEVENGGSKLETIEFLQNFEEITVVHVKKHSKTHWRRKSKTFLQKEYTHIKIETTQGL